MALAFNDKGDAVYHDGSSWKPAPVATNDKGEKVYFDGKSWAPKDASAAGSGAPVNPLAVPGGSQDPARFKRYARTAAKIAVGTALPIAAGAAAGMALGPEVSPAAAALTRIGVQGIAGALTPYAETATGRLLGENTAMPSWRDAATSGLINMAFAGLGEGASGKWAGADASVAPEMAAATPNIKNLKQAARNRDTWKALGLSDEQADLAVKAPDAEEFLQRSMESANKTKGAFQNIVDSTRQDFKSSYDDAYTVSKGPSSKTSITINGNTRTTETGLKESLLDKPVADTSTLTKAFNVAGQPGSERELSPGFAKWLNAKEAQLKGGTTEYVGIGDTPFEELTPNLQEQIKATTKAKPPASFTIQDLRDMKTELRENMPSGASATPLDKKAAAQVQQAIDQVHDSELQKLGASNEQIGRIKGIDADYGVFMDTVKTLDPRSEKLGQSVNDALWNPMLNNPDQAANLIRYAKRASDLNPDVMPQLRESFLNKAVEQARTGNAPMGEMKALQTLQSKWGEKGGTQVVLNELFGKDSPLSNSKTLAQVLGAPPLDPQKLGWAQNMAQRAASAPYLLRMGVLYGLAGGGMMAITRDPEKAAIAIAGLASLQIGGKLLGRLGSAGQEAYVNFRLNPSETSFKNFMKVSGAMIGATTEMPSAESASR